MKNGHNRDEIRYWSTLINTVYLGMHAPRLFYLSLVPSVVMTNYFSLVSSHMYSRRSVWELICFHREAGNLTLLIWHKVTKRWLFYRFAFSVAQNSMGYLLINMVEK